jgi:hypothetical protein
VRALVVDLEVLLQFEPLAAALVVAHPNPFLGMGLLVTLERAILRELLKAKIAFVWFHTSVDAGMAIQRPSGAEFLQTPRIGAQQYTGSRFVVLLHFGSLFTQFFIQILFVFNRPSLLLGVKDRQHFTARILYLFWK